jgi:hypothetical protein
MLLLVKSENCHYSEVNLQLVIVFIFHFTQYFLLLKNSFEVGVEELIVNAPLV